MNIIKFDKIDYYLSDVDKDLYKVNTNHEIMFNVNKYYLVDIEFEEKLKEVLI